MLWISATPAQRAAITAADERKNEKMRNTAEYQRWIRAEIAKLETRRDSKKEELVAGGHARKLTRQIGDLDREIQELSINIRAL